MALVQVCLWRPQNPIYPARRKNRKQKPFQAPRPFLLLSWHSLREVILVAGTSRRNIPLLSAHGFMCAAGNPGGQHLDGAASSELLGARRRPEVAAWRSSFCASRLSAVLSKQRSVLKRRTRSWLGLFLVCILASLWLQCSGSWGLSAGKPMK